MLPPPFTFRIVHVPEDPKGVGTVPPPSPLINIPDGCSILGRGGILRCSDDRCVMLLVPNLFLFLTSFSLSFRATLLFSVSRKQLSLYCDSRTGKAIVHAVDILRFEQMKHSSFSFSFAHTYRRKRSTPVS